MWSPSGSFQIARHRATAAAPRGLRALVLLLALLPQVHHHNNNNHNNGNFFFIGVAGVQGAHAPSAISSSMSATFGGELVQVGAVENVESSSNGDAAVFLDNDDVSSEVEHALAGRATASMGKKIYILKCFFFCPKGVASELVTSAVWRAR